jgi:hypothetical protein|uniref:Uncharacterized protein n=1 Tax=Picea glauca TaxID=3330 RepID=A0A117NJ16_PICGL|nr:hypothetical protein ABT39_MTgene3191 [Picea glauca]KUM50735.1 hypothetical protein ABT39_MTgene579 [Picea glauca]
MDTKTTSASSSVELNHHPSSTGLGSWGSGWDNHNILASVNPNQKPIYGLRMLSIMTLIHFISVKPGVYVLMLRR